MASAILQQLLMNMMGADSLESLKNPAYQALDENGNPMPGYVDPSFKGNPDDAIKKYGTSDPYIQPDVFTRAFKPQIASQVDAQNLLGYNSQVANTAQNQVGATNTQLASKVYGMPYIDAVNANPAAASRVFPNQTPEGVLSANTAVQSQKLGQDKLSALVGAGNSSDIIRREASRLSGNLPELETGADAARANYASLTLPSAGSLAVARNTNDLSLEPSRTLRDLFSNAAQSDESSRAIRNADTLDKIYGKRLDTTLSAGNIDNTLTKAKEKSLPLLTQAQHQELLNGIWGLVHPELPQMPYYRNPSTGTPERNPAYINTMEIMKSKLGKDGTTPSGHISVGNGLNILPNNISSTNTTVNPTHASLLTKADLTPITRQVNVGTEGGSETYNPAAMMQDNALPLLRTVGNKAGKISGTALQYLEMILKGQSPEDYFQSHKRF